MLIFRQLFHRPSSTYTYLLANGNEAVLIDPVLDNASRDYALLRELGLRLLATLDTHVHADHVTGAWFLKQRCGSRILLAEAAQAANVDLPLRQGDQVSFGRRHLKVRATPGHTPGCVTYVLDDQLMAFTGDSLLVRGCGRTDFQQGSAGGLFRSIKRQILTLPDECLLYPAHDYRGINVTSVAEERRFNPRLGGKVDEADFSAAMDHLGLPRPASIDSAIQANMRCGAPGENPATSSEPSWAQLAFRVSGAWEIEPEDLADCAKRVQIIDVREPDEIRGRLGRIHGSCSFPLSQLSNRIEEIDKRRPVITVCRSGVRSAQATILLRKAGFVQVAGLAGGMLRWRAARLPVEGSAPAA